MSRATLPLLLALLATAPVVVSVPTAHAVEPVHDAGLAVVVTGEVNLQAATGEAQPLTPFMKLRPGDRVSLAEAAQIDLVFFDVPLRQRWTGPVTLTVAPDGATAEAGAEPELLQVDGMIGAPLADLPYILQRAELDLAGQRKIRSDGSAPLDPEEEQQVQASRDAYAAQVAGAPEGDILAEMALVSVLIRHAQDAEAEELLRVAIGKCPTCREPAMLLEWLVSRHPRAD